MPDPTNVVGRRIVAYIIDFIIIGAVALIAFVSQAELYEDVGSNFCDVVEQSTDNYVCLQSDQDAFVLEGGGEVATVIAIPAVAGFLYFVVLQGLTGATLGKLMLGVRVVRADGRAPGIGRAVVRWLFLVVDTFPYFLPLVGFITALASNGHRRVGDKVAGTYVIRADAMGRPIGEASARVPDPAWPSSPSRAGFPPSAPGSPPAPPPGSWTPPPPPPPSR